MNRRVTVTTTLNYTVNQPDSISSKIGVDMLELLDSS